MKNVIGKIIIGFLFFSNFCASPLLVNASANEHSSHHAEIKAATNHHKLACCENHEKETGPTASLNSNKKPVKTVTVFLPSNNLNERSNTRLKLWQTEIIPRPSHKYLASIIRLE